jgi:PEGA domain-containing protein
MATMRGGYSVHATIHAITGLVALTTCVLGTGCSKNARTEPAKPALDSPEPAGTIWLSVKAAHGVPIASGFAIASRDIGSQGKELRRRSRHFTSEEGQRIVDERVTKISGGTAEIENLAPGHYVVYVSDTSDHGLCDVVRKVDVRKGEQTPLEVVLDVGGTLVVSVRDPAGVAIQDVDVYVRDAAGREVDFEFDSSTPGQLRFEPLEAGKYSIEISKESFEPCSLRAELRRGETTTLAAVLRNKR